MIIPSLKSLVIAACIFVGTCAGIAQASDFLQGGAVSNPAQISSQWTTGPGANGHYYILTMTPGSWTAEEAQAVAMGGHVVSITSADEENFLINTFLDNSSPVATKPLWIGLTDANNGLGSRNYTNWTTGEAVSFTFWNDSSEPNNLNNNEDYVALNWHYSFGATTVKGTWDDVPLNGTTVDYGGQNSRSVGPYYGIVEIVPEPSTNLLLGLGMIVGLAWLWRRYISRAI